MSQLDTLLAQIHDRQSRTTQRGRRWTQAGVRSSKILIAGAGNVGAPAAMAAAQLGFGTIDIVDADIVSPPNLSRGIVYRWDDLDKPKAEVVASAVRAISTARVTPMVADLRFDLGPAAFREYDIILLCTHDVASRKHVSTYAHLLPGRTAAIIEGGLFDLSFSVQTTRVGQDPCYACSLDPNLVDDGGIAQGCNGVVTEAATGPAPSTGADGMIVGALLAKEAALIAADLDPLFGGKELRCDGESGRVAVYERTFQPGCDGHRQLRSGELIEVPLLPTTLVGDVRRAVAGTLSTTPAAVSLFSPHLITTALTCRCGGVLRVMRPQAQPVEPVCPSCGEQDPTAFTADFLSDLPDSTRIRELGLPAHPLLEAWVGDRQFFVASPRAQG